MKLTKLAVTVVAGAVAIGLFVGTAGAGTRPLTKADCKDGGWQALGYKNQGDCVSASNHGATVFVPAPSITIEAPIEGQAVRGAVEVRAVVDPDGDGHVVEFARSIAGAGWEAIGTDSSSPYTVLDQLPELFPAGTPIRYQALLREADGTAVTSPVRTVRVAEPPLTAATLHYFRPAGDYGDWGLHLWGEAVDAVVLSEVFWDNPWRWSRVEDGWAVYEIPLADDTKPVNFIMHLPSGDHVPDTREPGGDRSFVPLNSPKVWIKQGDATVYTSQPPTP